MKRNPKHMDMPLFGDPRFTAMLFILAVCSGYFTYQGAAMVIDTGIITWTGHTGALIFAIASSTAIFILWTAAPNAIAKLKTAREYLLGMCITIISSLMIISLSSWLNVAGIAGGAATETHMNHLITTFEDVLDKRYEATVAIKEFQSDLKQAESLYLARRDQEFERGAYTGHPGPGTVEILLGTIATRFEQQEKAVAIELIRMTDVAQQARQNLEAMRTVANHPGTPKARMENLAREADNLRALLGELNPKGMLNGLQRNLQAMPREVGLQSISAKTKKGGEDQRAALKRLEVELTKTVDQLRTDLKRLSDLPKPSVPTVTRLNAIEAVFRYPLQHAPYWAGGIAMDFTPTLLLFYALLVKAARGRRGLFTDRVGNMTVNELKAAQHALEAIRDGRVSPDSISQLHDDLTGESKPAEEDNDKSI